MCISAAVMAGAALLSAGVSAAGSISTANANKANTKYQNAVADKQRRERMQLEQLAAMEEENTRFDDFERMRSASLAAIGASGLAENISFFQAIDPEQQEALKRDVRNVRLGLTSEQAGIADQIRVGAYGVKIAEANAGAAKIGAVADFASAAMSAANFYQQYRPAKAPAGGG